MPQQDQEYQQLQSNLDLTSKLLDETHRMKAPVIPGTQIPTSSGTKQIASSTTTPTKAPVAQDHSYITRLPTFAERGKAIAQRLDAIKADPKYQALPDDRKAKVRADLYKKLVPASYAGFHLPVPDEKTWVEGSGKSTTLSGPHGFQYVGATTKLSNSYGPGQDATENANVAADKTFNNIAMFGANITHEAFNGMYSMAQHFTPGPLKDSAIGVSAKQALHTAQRTTQNFADAAHSRIQSDDFWLQTHPDNTIIGSLATKSGEVIAGLPLWDVLGEAGVGGRMLESMKAAPVTARLLATAPGKAVAHRLISATAAYGATLAGTGGDTAQAASMAKFDVGFGAALGAAGAVKELGAYGAGKAAGNAIRIASSALAKKWTASVVAEGGIPFAQDIATSAAHELSPLDWWLKNGTEAGVPKYGSGSMQVGRDLAIIPHGDDEGHFVNTKTNQTYYYKGKQEQQLMFDHLHKENLQLREQEDPVMAKLHEAEKTTLNSISLRTTGTFFEHLSDEQKLDVLGHRMEQIWGAAKEAPVHLPEQLHEQIDGNIKAERAADPKLHALMSQDEQMFGAKFADVYTENATEAVAKETGISNQRGAARALASSENAIATTSSNELPRDLRQSKPRYGYQNKNFELQFEDPRDLAAYTTGQANPNKAHDRFVSYLESQGIGEGTAAQKSQELRNFIKTKAATGNPADGPIKIPSSFGKAAKSGSAGAPEGSAYHKSGLAKGDDITPNKFASLNADSLSYLRAPRDRSGVDFLGKRSKDAYDKTYQLLKQADGGFFRAERPVQRFLYHYADKAKLPAGLRQSVLHWIKETPGWSGKSEAEIYKEAKYMRVHMYDMAKSGHLKAEGNIFASTKTEGPMSWSPWQAPLSNESDQQVIKATQKALARHPEALKGYNAMVKMIQKSMVKTNTPEELQALKDQLDKGSRGIVTHLSRGTAKVGY